MAADPDRAIRRACLASMLGVHPADLPAEEADQTAWLAEHGVGLVPVADPASFAWGGPWLARRPARDGSGPRSVVLFGVPPGAIWDPAGTTEEILEGHVIAALDLSVWSSPATRDPGRGVVEALVLGPERSGPLAAVDGAQALAGRGLEGDRYADGTGTFASGRPGSALTLVDADVLDELAAGRGAPIDHRRNVVVRGTVLEALVGRTFRLGGATCRGRRLCEPCAHLDRLNGGGVLRPLVHRGGLRADIDVSGAVRVGDPLVPDEQVTGAPPPAAEHDPSIARERQPASGTPTSRSP